MTQQQGSLSVDRMCALGQVSRAGYYRHWQAVAPRTAETALRDEVQRLALAQRHYGYRRIAILLRRAGWQVNRKRVLRLMREDNLLCLRKKAFVPATTDFAPQLAGLSQLGLAIAADRSEPAVGCGHHLRAAGGGLCLSGGRARCVQPARDRLDDGGSSRRQPGSGCTRDGAGKPGR